MTPRSSLGGQPNPALRAGQKAARSRSAESRPGRLLRRAFFEAAPELVAPRLLGKVLAHHTPSGLLSGRIVEVEAYLGPHNDPPDPAAHAYRGPTPRNAVIFGPAGHAYVYAIYGRYFCMNVTCEIEGRAGCILIRALEPLTGLQVMALNRGLTTAADPSQLTAGPSRLCQALGLTRAAHNALDLLSPSSPLQLLDDGFQANEVHVTPRIGIRVAVELPLRFVLSSHPCLSGPKSLAGPCVLRGKNSVKRVKVSPIPRRIRP